MASFASFVSAAGVCASKGGGSCATNTALGCLSLSANSTGTCNTGIGYKSLFAVTTGSCNTGIGYKALCSNSTGSGNTGIGSFAGICMISGTGLTAVGHYAAKLTTGNRNTAIGKYAACGLTSATDNVIVGAEAGISLGSSGCCNVGVGYKSLRCATGDGNTAVGRYSGFSFSSGSCNIAIGPNAANSGGATTANWTIAVGANSQTSNTTGHTAWGNASVQYAGVSVAWTVVSDRRDKTNIQDLDEKLGLEFVRGIETYSFNWDHRDLYVLKCGYEYGTKDGTLVSQKKAYGFSAQQMKSVIDELEVHFDALGYDPEKDSHRLSYSGMIAPLVKSVQQTKARLEYLENLAG